MRVLIGCEASGIIRTAFTNCGWDAWSCDLKETELPGNHIKGNVLNVLNDNWDLAIFHPECKYICNAGSQTVNKNKERFYLRQVAFEFLLSLWNAPIKHICLENSLSYWLNARWKKPTQTIHPYHFGEPYKKATCLWLKALPPVIPTNILQPGNRLPHAILQPGNKMQAANRAKSFQGIANAMATQWTQYFQQQ
jgi:hypothetical protein